MENEKLIRGVHIGDIKQGSNSIQTISSVIGLVGTAYGNINEMPVMVSSLEEAKLKIFGHDDVNIYSSIAGTILRALDAIFKQSNASVVVVAVSDKIHYEAGIEKLVCADEYGLPLPNILLVPEASSDDVVKSLAKAAKTISAVAIIDLADNKKYNDIKKAVESIDDCLSRLYLIAHKVKVYDEIGGEDIEMPASPFVAGLMTKSDQQRGFWWSPSNQVINGVSGIVDLDDSIKLDKRCATIIRQNGFRLWGNYSCSNDDRWAFISVRRTADMINASLAEAHYWAIDRNITSTYVESVTGYVNEYLKSLKLQGAIIDGHCWVDPDANTVSDIKAGHVVFDFDFSAPYPVENITFSSRLASGDLG